MGWSLSGAVKILPGGKGRECIKKNWTNAGEELSTHDPLEMQKTQCEFLNMQNGTCQCLSPVVISGPGFR